MWKFTYLLSKLRLTDPRLRGVGTFHQSLDNTDVFLGNVKKILLSQLLCTEITLILPCTSANPQAILLSTYTFSKKHTCSTHSCDKYD